MREAKAALTDFIERYRDVLGPQCWCSGVEDCEERPCPTVSPTVGLTAWVIVSEWSDLDPEGDSSVAYQLSPTCGASRAVGMLTRAAGNL